MASAAAGSLREHPRQRGEQAARREANPLRRFAPALPKGEVSPKVTERALPLPCGELPPQRLRGLEMAEHKKALSEAASFFVWSPSSLGLKGASSPFLVGPARRNRRALAALNTRHLLRKPVCGLKAPLGLSCPPGTAVLSGSLLVPKENKLRPVKLFRIIQKLLFISCFSASTVRGESTRGCCGRPSGRRTARRSPC